MGQKLLICIVLFRNHHIGEYLRISPQNTPRETI